MRTLSTGLAALALTIAILGCGNNDGNRVAQAPAQQPAADTRGGLSLYPLSNAQPVPPLQNQAYGPTNLVAALPPDYYAAPAQYNAAPADPGYTTTTSYTTVPAGYSPAPTGYSTAPAQFPQSYPTSTASGYCEVTDITAYSPTTIPNMPDPPFVVNEPYQSGGYAVTATSTSYPGVTTYSAPVATTTTYTSAPQTTTYNTSTPATYSGSTYTAPVQASTSYTTTTQYTRTYVPAGASAATRPSLSATTTTAPASYYAPTVPSGPGYRLVPALDIPPGNHPNDAGPSQWFEIVRPDNGPIRIGRVSATCVCVGVRVPNRFIAAGERALIEARTITRPPYNNLTYGIYVNIVEPVSQMVDADVTISL